MRHLKTVNIFLQFAEHHFVLIPRKFSSHHTQMPHTAGCVLPMGTRGVGYKHPASCGSSSYIYTIPRPSPCACTAPHDPLINTLVRDPRVAPCAVNSLAAGQGGAAFWHMGLQCQWGNFWQYQTLSGSCWSPPRQRFMSFF